MWWINHTKLTLTRKLSQLLLTQNKQLLHRSRENRCDKISELIRGRVLSYSKPPFDLKSKLPKFSGFLANHHLLQRKFNWAQFSSHSKQAASDGTSYISRYIKFEFPKICNSPVKNNSRRCRPKARIIFFNTFLEELIKLYH